MITIIHGNDIQKTRESFFELKSKTESFVLLNGEKLSFDLFFQNIEGDSFFEREKTIFIENLFAGNKSNTLEFKKIIDYINSKKNLNLVFWEGSELSKTQIGLIKNSQISNYSIPSLLFVFLDSLKPNSYKNSLSLFNRLRVNLEEELIWFMLVRQFRLLMSTVTNSSDIDEAKRLATWQLSKLKSQANLFGEEKLRKLYKKLFDIEQNHKTGKVSFGLNKSIDFFLADL